MSKTVVGLFSTYAKAQQVKQELVAKGYEAQNITVVANDDEELSGSSSSADLSRSTGTASSGTSTTGSLSSGAAGIGEKVGSFFRNLTGGDDTAHQHYASGVNSGGALLAVTVNDPQAAEVADLLTQHGASEIEGEYATSSGSTPASSSSAVARTGAATTAVGETSIPIIEEELVVGKRQVERGGVRIYSHVTERPVDASVTLHEERIEVERRPVNRAATAADFAAGSGATIEMRATGEEAVVGKSSRVVEEVLIGKQSSDRTEQVHDSVRKTEVEVENIAAEPTTTASTTSTSVPTKSGY